MIFNTQTGEATSHTFDTHFTLMIHPVTYINKLLFAGGDAANSLQLWNVIEQKKVFEFKLKGDSSIECLQQSPVVDIVAVGCTDGQIHLMNLRFN